MEDDVPHCLWMQRVVFFLCFGHVKRPRDPSPSVSQAENEVERVPDGQRARWPERQGMFWRKWGARFLFPFFKRHILFVCERFGIARGSPLPRSRWHSANGCLDDGRGGYLCYLGHKTAKIGKLFFFPCYIYIYILYCNTFYLFHCRCVLPILVNIVRTQWDDHGIMVGWLSCLHWSKLDCLTISIETLVFFLQRKKVR